MKHGCGNWARGFAVAMLLGAAMACGGGSDSPTSPTPPSTGGGGSSGAADSATITITSDGVVSPSTVTIRQGGRVTFTNSSSRNHEMNSDPHPEHTDCPELNAVGHLESGQQRESGNLNVARRCGFHDHINENNRALQGAITIQ